MGRTLALVLGSLILGCTLSAALPAHAAGAPHLYVQPIQGHAGDPVFLSGGRFAPHRRVQIAAVCGGHHSVVVATALANGLGRFKGVHGHFPASGVGRCTFSAHTSSTAETARASARLRPRDSSIAPCSRHICVHVQAILVRLKSGARGTVVISAWPGAIASVTVARREAGAKYRATQLDWRGVGSITVFVAPGLLKGLLARVFVHVHEGHFSGAAAAPFHVLFGNR